MPKVEMHTLPDWCEIGSRIFSFAKKGLFHLIAPDCLEPAAFTILCRRKMLTHILTPRRESHKPCVKLNDGLKASECIGPAKLKRLKLKWTYMPAIFKATCPVLGTRANTHPA